MKKVLSLLVAFVFLHNQSWALSGGPQLGLGATSVTGTYAGVMVPSDTTSASGTEAAASIGLFSLVVPLEGLAKGVATVFVNGTAYQGTASGVGNPKTAELLGILDLQSQPIYDPVDQFEYTISAQGNLKAQAEQKFSVGAYGGSSAGITLNGTADLDLFQYYDDNGPVVTKTAKYLVQGYKQSENYTSALTDALLELRKPSPTPKK